MPRERIFGPFDYETYGQHLERLSDATIDDYTPESKAAALMATVMMMRFSGANKRIDREQFRAIKRQISGSKAFKQMMKDPKAIEMVRNNNTEGLITTMADVENKRQQELDAKYKRPVEKEVLTKDAELLNAAIEGLKKKAGGAPVTGSPEIEQRGRRYAEMIKRLENAKTLAENGVQLSGESTKALIDSVMAYNDGGTRNVKPGGEKEAEGFVESMALLKNYMPAAEFNRYCKRMNTARGIESPGNLNYVAPEAFEPQRLAGAKTAKQLAAENRQQIRDSFTLDTAAEAIAIQQLSGGNDNKLISRDALERQKGILKQPGSAFMRVMMDEKAREDLRSLADLGETQEVVNDLNKGIEKETERKRQEAKQRLQEIRDRAKRHVVRTAQGEINRSVNRLTGNTRLNRHFTEQHLANILASEQLAMNAKGDEKITNGAFRERAEELRQDPAFQRLAEHYINDPAFRRSVNQGLQRDRSAQSLRNAFELEKQPRRTMRDREQDQPQVQNQEPEVQRPEQQAQIV